MRPSLNNMKTDQNKAIFLDRDGTINFDLGYVYRVEDWQWADENVPQALRMLQKDGYKLIVVTNQSGIGHGLYTLSDMEILHKHMEEELRKEDVRLDLIMYCPHARDAGCACRKPRMGMITDAAGKINGIDLAQSWTIGDKLLDMEMGQNAGTKTVLLKSRYWVDQDIINRAKKPDIIASSLFEAAMTILKAR